jgi:hypothetical protein
MSEYEERIAQLTYAKAAGTLRFLERNGCKRQTEMAALCERAAETAPERERDLWNRRLKVYRAGRIVKIGIGEIVSLDGVPVEIIDEINAVEQEMEGE